CLSVAIAKIPIGNILWTISNTDPGLFNQSEQTHYSGQEEDDHSSNYLLLINGPSPSLIPVPTHVLKAHIRETLPVMELGHFQTQQEQDSSVCHRPICLVRLERSHRIRLPCNCDHVFHIEWINNWVHEDHFTCPLCRGNLRIGVILFFLSYFPFPRKLGFMILHF
ncbi:Zinc finger, RING/FYVE/PHD-type, partial [Trema orientale]